MTKYMTKLVKLKLECKFDNIKIKRVFDIQVIQACNM